MDPITRSEVAGSDIEDYRRRGYLVLRGLLGPVDAERIAEDVLDVLRARAMNDSCLAQTGEYLAASAIDGLVNSARLRGLMSQLMAGGSSLYMPFSAVKGPGQGAFKFHQDNQYTRLDGPACNAWFALRPTTVANGCLRVVAGSHRHGVLASKAMFEDGSHRTVIDEPESWDEVELAAGDCVVFDRLTVHASGPNQTGEHRVAYAVQFHRNDVKWYDSDADEWNLLTEHPRWPTAAVEELTKVSA